MKIEPKYVKSPFNYIGGKYKLLGAILPEFPQNINNFIDLFGGGGNISLNVKANRICYNDIIPEVVSVFKEFQKKSYDEIISTIKDIIYKYKLSSTNEESFKKYRDFYNSAIAFKDDMPYHFFVLTCYSFNYQFRFNNKGEYNSSFGKNKSQFTETTKQKILKFKNRLNQINIEFYNYDFRKLNMKNLSTNDFVYLDPPYLITNANYNDGNTKNKKLGWTFQDDLDLMNLCDELNSKNIKFAMSNVLLANNKTNDGLINWSKKYNINYINNTYNNCSYHKKNENKNKTIEVLIKNY